MVGHIDKLHTFPTVQDITKDPEVSYRAGDGSNGGGSRSNEEEQRLTMPMCASMSVGP